jgi:hypothetical protein
MGLKNRWKELHASADRHVFPFSYGEVKHQEVLTFIDD